MKKLIITLFCFGSITALAQNGLFMQTNIGAGRSNAAFQSPPGSYYEGPEFKSLPAYNANLLVGYQFNHVVLAAGLCYGTFGDKKSFETGDFIYEEVVRTQNYSCIAVPLTVGYKFNFSHNFSFIPAIGTEFSYNIGAHEKTDVYHVVGGPPSSSTEHTLTRDEFMQQYHNMSSWGIAKADFEYRVSDRLHVVAGPQLQYMIQSFLKDPNFTQRNNAYTFNAGIKLHLKKSANPKG